VATDDSASSELGTMPNPPTFASISATRNSPVRHTYCVFVLCQPASKTDPRSAFNFRRRLTICHSAMTADSGLTEEVRREIGITPALIRVSIGLEHPVDLVADVTQAFT
jgi:hypothetical protein